MAAQGGKERQSYISDRLISLVDRAGRVPPEGSNSIYRVVAVNFDAIAAAREAKITWREIAAECDFAGRENRMRDAFSKERRRRAKKEKEVMPEKKWIPGPKEEKKKSPGLERLVPPAAGRARLIEEQKPEDLFNSMPKM